MANKCAIAARVDCFSEQPTTKFGETLKEQMEERLKFLASGTKPRKNADAMKEVIDELKQEGLFYDQTTRVQDDDAFIDDKENEKNKQKKDKKDKKDKKEKKDKKRKREELSDDEDVEQIKPKKKKSKHE